MATGQVSSRGVYIYTYIPRLVVLNSFYIYENILTLHLNTNKKLLKKIEIDLFII